MQNEQEQPAAAGPVHCRVRPCCWMYVDRKGRRQAWFGAEPHDLCPCIPLYEATPMSEGALMGVYMDFDRKADKTWTPAEYLLRFAVAVQDAIFKGPNPQLTGRAAGEGPR